MDNLDPKTCRLCFQYNKELGQRELSDLYKNNETILASINFFFKIEADFNNITLNYICASCLEKLDTVYEIYQGFLKAEQEILDFLEQNLAKQEHELLYEEVEVLEAIEEVEIAPEISKTKCYICLTVFETEDKFVNHFSQHFHMVPYKCEICVKTIRQTKALSQHLGLHNVEDRPHKCRQCERRFRTRMNALTHERVYHKYIVKIRQNIDGFADKLKERMPDCTCRVCGKVCKNKDTLKRHENVHTGAMKVDCTICSKTFSSKKNLSRHMLIHTGERPYKCTIPNCNKDFKQSGDLKDHMRKHSGEKPYKCNICAVRYRNSSLLSHHRSRCRKSL